MTDPRSTRQPLPRPAPLYDERDQRMNRSQIERNFGDLSVEIDNLRTGTDSAATVASMKFRFLMMARPNA